MTDVFRKCFVTGQDIEDAAEQASLEIEWRGDDYGCRRGYYKDMFRAGAAYIMGKPNLEKTKVFLKNLRDNYDCDNDAHKYGTPCRSCDAAKILGEVFND